MNTAISLPVAVRTLSIYESIKCPICQKEVPQTFFGRPKQYHKECRRFEQLASWLEDVISDMDITPEGAKIIRSRLWYLANLTNSKKK